MRANKLVILKGVYDGKCTASVQSLNCAPIQRSFEAKVNFEQIF
jgi:hypothetical protein